VESNFAGEFEECELDMYWRERSENSGNDGVQDGRRAVNRLTDGANVFVPKVAEKRASSEEPDVLGLFERGLAMRQQEMKQQIRYDGSFVQKLFSARAEFSARALKPNSIN
jgi:hypothetical protein